MDFRSRLNIPNTLADIGIKLDSKGADKIGELAILDAASGGNPIAFDANQYQTIFENAVNGKLEVHVN